MGTDETEYRSTKPLIKWRQKSGFAIERRWRYFQKRTKSWTNQFRGNFFLTKILVELFFLDMLSDPKQALIDKPGLVSVTYILTLFFR